MHRRCCSCDPLLHAALHQTKGSPWGLSPWSACFGSGPRRRRSGGGCHIEWRAGSLNGNACEASPSCDGIGRRSLGCWRSTGRRSRRQPPASGRPEGFHGEENTICSCKRRLEPPSRHGTSTAEAVGGRRNWRRWMAALWLRLEYGRRMEIRTTAIE